MERTPSPATDENSPLQALVFDSHFDQYRGVVSSVRVMQGRLDSGMSVRFMQAGTNHQLDEVGVWRPDMTPVKSLGAGEVGYVLAGIKDVGEARSGETITTATGGSEVALSGYQEPKPMVFSGLYPIDGDDFGDFEEPEEQVASLKRPAAALEDAEEKPEEKPPMTKLEKYQSWLQQKK